MTRAISDEVTVVTQLPVARRKPRENQGAHLIVLSGTNVGQVFNLAKGTTKIGRDDASQVQIMDAGISRNHAKITRQKGNYVLEDAGSRNGTFANNTRVDEPVRLSDGDKIQIGVMTVLKFAYTDDPEANYAQAMYEAAHRDGLTGIFNRRYFEDRLQAEFSYAVRHGSPLSLLMLDLDHFKQVNDTHGHVVGDQVLKDFAHLVEQTTRADDVLARYGGEEFTVLCRQTSLQKASILGERIRHEVSAHTFAGQLSRGLNVTASIGIASLPDPEITVPEQMVTTADEALYQAKARGRNCVVAHRPG